MPDMNPADAEAIVTRWEGPLVNFLGRMTGNRATGEDLAQETLLRVLGEAPAGAPAGWVWTVALNLGRDHLRRSRFEVVGLEEEGVSHRRPSAGLEERELRDGVQDALRSLPESDRACLVLKDMEGVGYGTLAEALGIPEASARVRVHRARERFRDLWLSRGGSGEAIHASA